jgi:signal transduction histidine kinase/DNA-binding response OmpR family regulator
MKKILREAEERTKIMLDAAPLCAIFWDKNIKMLDCNQEVVKMFGVSNKQEFIEKFTIFSPDYQPDGILSVEKGPGFIKKAMDEGYSRFEWMHQNLNKELIPAEVTCVRVKYRDEDTIIEYIRDLREQKAMMAADEKIREANERIQAIFEATPLAITMWDPETHKLIDCNMEAVRLVGLPDKKVYIEKFAEMTPEYQSNGQKTSELVAEIFDKTMRDGVHHYNWDQRAINGEVIPFQVNAVRLKHLDGYIIIAYARDMRETNIAIAKMREADERVQLMFDALPFGASFWDEDLNIINCNNEILKLFDLSSKQEFIDRFLELSPEYQPDGSNSKEKAFEYLKEALNEDYCRYEWVHQKLNGEPIPAEVIFVRVKYRGKYSLTAYIRDLREQKAMIAEMRRAEIAIASNKAKSDFLARVSHEIRTPMNAILGISEIQLQDEIHSPEIKEAFERIYNSGSLLLGIINDILDLSKIEAGKLELNLAQYDIASLIHDIVQINIMRYEAKSIEFVLDVNEDLPLLLIGDELRIKQILNNLLSNAFKYTEKGAVKLTVFDEPAEPSDMSKINIVFIISDTGQGMTADQVQKLGSEYSRFNMEANRGTEGTGLGMNITRNLVQLMDGTISVDSTPRIGSIFTVRLPQEKTSSAVIGKEIANNLMRLNLDNSVKLRAFNTKKEYLPYGRVLLVDDVETNLYVARGLLAPYGLTIETVMSGFEAINKVKDGLTYDIIFMDHMMPRMDGIEATRIIRDLGYTKPIVALTANAIAGQAAMFLASGFDDFISKPIDIRQLNMTLNKLIRDKHPAEVVEAARKQKAVIHSGSSQKKALEPELAEIFTRDAKKALAELEIICSNNFRRDDDLSAFIINIHAMKSALANIGEAALSAEALKLEQIGRENNTDLLLSEIPSFMEKLRTIIKKIEPKDI